MEAGFADADDVTAEPEAATALRPTFSWGAGTHVGGVRDHNEDAFFVSDDVCAVADGMGGHAAGEVAAQLVTHIIEDVFGTQQLDVSDLPALVSGLNAAVLRRGAENGTQGMGTTVVGLAIADNGGAPSAIVFHVGDSRCYRLCNGVMAQLTSDHSHVQELVQAGHITPEEALTHPLRNVITRALGAAAAVEADFHVLEEEDCRILLCSDGLSGEIDDDRIWDLLTSHADPTAAAVALIDAVLEGSARDNVTAIVVDVAFPEPALPEPAVAENVAETSPPVAGDLADDDTADLDRDTTQDPLGDVTAEPLDATLEYDVSTEAFASARSDAADHADEVGAATPWEPPDAIDRRSGSIDRPPAAPDGAAWGTPHADHVNSKTATDQETGHDRHDDH